MEGTWFAILVCNQISETMKSRQELSRRTFSQERFEILIKKQKEGRATFSQLTELDEIVNRDPEIRRQVIRESFATGDEEPGENSHAPGEARPANQTTLRGIGKVWSFLKSKFRINRFFSAWHFSFSSFLEDYKN